MKGDYFVLLWKEIILPYCERGLFCPTMKGIILSHHERGLFCPTMKGDYFVPLWKGIILPYCERGLFCPTMKGIILSHHERGLFCPTMKGDYFVPLWKGIILSHLSESYLHSALWVRTTEAEIKPRSAEILELSKNLSLKSEVSQNVALHVSLTTKNSAFLISTFPVHLTAFSLLLFNMKWRETWTRDHFHLWVCELCFDSQLTPLIFTRIC